VQGGDRDNGVGPAAEAVPHLPLTHGTTLQPSRLPQATGDNASKCAACTVPYSMQRIGPQRLGLDQCCAQYSFGSGFADQ
jgi:hypothetical protein